MGVNHTYAAVLIRLLVFGRPGCIPRKTGVCCKYAGQNANTVPTPLRNGESMAGAGSSGGAVRPVLTHGPTSLETDCGKPFPVQTARH